MDVYSLTVVMGLTTHHYVMGEWTPFLVRRQWNAHSQDHVKPMQLFVHVLACSGYEHLPSISHGPDQCGVEPRPCRQLYFYLRLLLPRFQSRMTPHLLCASRTPGSSSGEPNLCALHMLFPLPGTSLQHPAPPCHPATLCQSNSNSSCRTQSDVTGSRSCPIIYVQRPKPLLHSTSSNGTPGTQETLL